MMQTNDDDNDIYFAGVITWKYDQFLSSYCPFSYSDFRNYSEITTNVVVCREHLLQFALPVGCFGQNSYNRRFKTIYSRPQTKLLHCWESSALPSQFFPPPEGLGLLHFRVLFLRPPPHVTEHSLHEPHWLQFPSTKKVRTKITVKNLQSLTYEWTS